MGLFDLYNANGGLNPNYIQNQVPQMRPMVPNPQPINMGQPRELEKVNGIESAKQYPMQPNSMVALFDMNDDIFYLKITDASNFPTIRKFRFVEEFDTQVQVSQPTNTEFVTKEEFNALKEELQNGQQHIWEAIDAATSPAESKPRIKANDSDVQDGK